MKIVSFNVNGLRARPHQLEALRDTLDPDIIGLQEIKVQDADFPRQMVEDIGYHAEFFGQKGHYGVALLSKKAPQSVSRGYATDQEDAQRRLITATYQSDNGSRVTVINGYFPQGENRGHETKFPNKRRFYQDLMTHLDSFTPDDNLVVMGDVNIARIDRDIGIGADNAKRWLRTGKCSFLPEEREWMERLMAWGLLDTFRELHPETNDRFSWFDYRSRGFDREPRRGLRIDLILATKAMQQRLRAAGINYTIRAMEKPSDHCPVWADFEL
ncbi:MAG: exodeoxyribonuclease III [Pseudomonadota bacterium]